MEKLIIFCHRRQKGSRRICCPWFIDVIKNPGSLWLLILLPTALNSPKVVHLYGQWWQPVAKVHMCPLVATQLKREIHPLSFILSGPIQSHVHDKVKVKKKRWPRHHALFGLEKSRFLELEKRSSSLRQSCLMAKRLNTWIKSEFG